MRALPLTLTFLLLLPATALAQASGEGLYGETNDKVVTDFGFILIGFFPLFIFLMSLLQYLLERRKDQRKKAAKLAGGDQRWSGGW
jgi:hypothetical protein